ncbi:MAG TPA: cobalamin-independent methionine synthase II family protein [Chloroflexota bacterium]|nr:cobalamin-independent methionine synthase II family protein [Chloroflexota bacterium]
MKRSEDRILTTHTGSLPRPQRLAEMMVDRERGGAVDAAALRAEVRSAVDDIVRAQVEAGVDVVNDGEVSKIGYSTYVKERLTGFGGSQTWTSGGGVFPTDLIDYPGFAQRMMTQAGAADFRMPACTGPIEVADANAVEEDIANLKAATQGAQAEDVFMSAASPGVIALFLSNTFYPTRETYLEAIARAMKQEYDAIARAGLVLQLDCPDLAMGRHIQFGNASLEEFRRNASMNVEALNYAVADIPPEQLRMHLCWGNYEGPHHRDVALRDIIDIVLSARPSAISLEGCNPRHGHEWRVFEGVKLPEGKLLIPGVIDSTNNYIEHPELIAQRIVQYAQLVGRENVLAGSDCGFGTFVGYSAVDPAITWAKFRAMADGARLASEQLWSRQLTAV